MGSALKEAEYWAKKNADELTPIERDFLESCRETQNELLATRRRRVAITFALTLVIFLVIVITGLLIWSESRIRFIETIANTNMLRSHSLVYRENQLAL